MADRLDTPLETRRRFIRRPQLDEDASGKISESIARFLGTPRFIIYLTRVLPGLDRVERRWGPDGPAVRQGRAAGSRP